MKWEAATATRWAAIKLPTPHLDLFHTQFISEAEIEVIIDTCRVKRQPREDHVCILSVCVHICKETGL